MRNRAAVNSAHAPSEPAGGPLSTVDAWTVPGWTLVLGLGGLVALFWQTVTGMVETWLTSSAFGHSLLVPLVSVYLIWRRRAELGATTPRPWFWGLVPMALAGIVWLIGDLGNAQVVQQFAFVGLVQAFVVTSLGLRVGRVLRFPLFYLYFAVPFGAFLIPPLQDFTAMFLVRALRLIGIPVFLDGVFLYIPSGAFEVAEACAGARFLIASVALGVLVAHVMYRQAWRRALFVGLSIVVPIIANGFRAFTIVMLAHLSDYEIAVSADHVTYGLIFLSIVIFCLLGLGMTFREGARDDPAHRKPPPRARPAPAGATLFALVCALGLAGAASGYAALSEDRIDPAATTVVAAPAVRAPWAPASHTAAAPAWQPQFPGADAEVLQTYSREGRMVDLHIAYYRYQRQGAEVVGSGNSLEGHERWERAASGVTEADVAGSPMAVAYTRLKSLDETGRMVWSWYWVDGELIADPYRAKLLEVRAKLLGKTQAAAVVSIATNYEDDPAEASARLQDFLDHLEPLDEVLALAARASGS